MRRRKRLVVTPLAASTTRNVLKGIATNELPSPVMSALLALCLLILHAIAPAPSAHVASRDLRAFANGVASSSDMAAAERAADHRGLGSVAPVATERDAVVWVRQASPLAGTFATRPDASARTPVAAETNARLSVEAAFASSVRVRTLDDSHAVSARGALLPYFPTAPPLRG